MRVVTPEPGDFLVESVARLGHQFVVTTSPLLVAMAERAEHMAAGCLDGVLAHAFRLEGRQFAMPVDDLVAVVVFSGRRHRSTPHHVGQQMSFTPEPQAPTL